MVYKKDLDLQKSWVELLYKIKELTGNRPADLNAVLFLIGVQELGMGAKSFSKEEKQDVLHIAICKVLSLAGYYVLEGHDQEGWPHWRLAKKLPRFDLIEQEKLLKIQILEYFKKEIDW
ncbi:hypothetical protein [Ekhidna sp.]|uniref:hypothetical protein n=1 Tax=Ekhidna sp. TaxID=2608089 RepID=UPI00329947B2